MLLSVFELMAQGQASYLDWATCISGLIKKKVSKQAIWKRINKTWVITVEEVLKQVLSRQAARQVKARMFSVFPNVWLQDSTSLHLPDALIEKYRGNRSNGELKSVAKLNVIVNALSGYCPLFEWSSFVVAEQKLSPGIMKIARAGDLVIRDLGYFVMETFRQLIEARIYFLSRLKYGINIYDKHTGKELDIVAKLKGKNHIDMEVVCGKKHKLEVRLVAIKLPNTLANERRRKARKNTQKGINHNKRYYALLDYSIFITTVKQDTWNYTQVAEAYRMRWNIELLFKSWKSGLHMENIIPDAKIKTERVEGFLYAALIYIALFQLILVVPLSAKSRKNDLPISIIKLTKWSVRNCQRWLQNGLTVALEEEILYYCRYDRRSNTNAPQRLERVFSSLS